MKRRNLNVKLIRRFLNISLAGCMLLSTSTGAHAVDYSFSTESASDYYSSTSYEDAYWWSPWAALPSSGSVMTA